MPRIDRHGVGPQALVERRAYCRTAADGVFLIGTVPSGLDCGEAAIDCNKRRTHWLAERGRCEPSTTVHNDP